MKNRSKAGTGFSRHHDALTAGREAAAAAKSGIDNPRWALAFCSGAMDHGLYLQGLRESLGDDVPVFGGSAIGVMTEKELEYQQNVGACMVFQSEDISLRPAVEKSLQQDAFGAGKNLGRNLGDIDNSSLILLFYDSIQKPAGQHSPPVLNSSTPLLSGLMEQNGASVPVVGAGLIGSYAFEHVSLFCGNSIERDCAVGLLLQGGLKPYYHIMHGCTPLDGVYHRITAKEGPVLYELDGRPITSVIDDLDIAGWRTQFPLEYLTIGVNCGERYGLPREEYYINRLITGITPDGRGVYMFEPDLEQGTEIQFMIRDSEKMMESVRKNCSMLADELHAAGDRPVMALYIDCAGRTAAYSRTDQEEAGEVQRLCRTLNIPLLGFYSGVEIAPLLGKPRGLDWTGVLLIMAEKR